MLLGEAVDAADGGADAAVALADVVAEEARDDEDQRQDGEGQKGQPPVDGEHHDGHHGEVEEVVHDGQNARGEHLVDGVHVGGDAGDQAAHGVGVEEADVHALHVAEDLAAQVEHQLLAGPLHQVGLNELKEVGQQQRGQVERGQAGNALHGIVGKQAAEAAVPAQPAGQQADGVVGVQAGREVAVDGHHDQVGAGDIAQGFEADGQRRDGGLNPVGAQVASEPAHEPGVVDLADGVFIRLFGFLLFFFGHRSGGVRLPLPLYEVGQASRGQERNMASQISSTRPGTPCCESGNL